MRAIVCSTLSPLSGLLLSAGAFFAQADVLDEYAQISGVAPGQAIECGKSGRVSGVHRNGVGSAQSFDEPVVFMVRAPHAKIGDFEYVAVTANGKVIDLRGEPADYRLYTLIFECNY